MMDEADGWLMLGCVAGLALLGLLHGVLLRRLRDDVEFLQVVARETDRSMP
jgi:hypothetical protein